MQLPGPADCCSRCRGSGARRRHRQYCIRLVAVVSAAARRTAASNCRRPAPRERRPSRSCFGEGGSAVRAIEFHARGDCGGADGSGSPDSAVGCLGRDTTVRRNGPRTTPPLLPYRRMRERPAGADNRNSSEAGTRWTGTPALASGRERAWGARRRLRACSDRCRPDRRPACGEERVLSDAEPDTRSGATGYLSFVHSAAG
jgi:hypothetical protein